MKRTRKTRRQLLAEKEASAKQRINKANSLKDPLESTSIHEYVTPDNQVVKLSCTRAKDASPECTSWVFDIMERNMKQMYEQSQWGWDSVAKQKELRDPAAWYLVASSNDEFLGFCHFRFDIDDRTEVLYCYEIQLEPAIRRKGLGHFMMSVLESMAILYQMQKVVLTVFKHNPLAIQFFYELG